MIKPVQILALLAIGAVVYYIFFAKKNNMMFGKKEAREVVDLGMSDTYDPNAFGTTKEADRRVTNYGVRPEFNVDPMPLGFGCGDCPKSGVPNPAPGQEHFCKAGPPSKRVVDAMGGHFQLNHICAPSTGMMDEPTQLGRFWKRNDCAAPESVGLDIRPQCTRCGN